MPERDNPYSFGHDRPGRPGGDEEASFEALDPGRGDSGYWTRFQERTLALVEPELARRRQALERMTVSEVVTSWSRAVVPVAMVAAAAAVMVLLTEPDGPASEPGPPGVEASPAFVEASPALVDTSGRPDESLDLAVDGGPIPTVDENRSDEIPVVVTVAAEAF